MENHICLQHRWNAIGYVQVFEKLLHRRTDFLQVRKDV